MVVLHAMFGCASTYLPPGRYAETHPNIPGVTPGKLSWGEGGKSSGGPAQPKLSGDNLPRGGRQLGLSVIRVSVYPRVCVCLCFYELRLCVYPHL